jgi:hypothetical protein
MTQSAILNSQVTFIAGENQNDVPFYPIDNALFEPLIDYLVACLDNGERCIVVATQHYLYRLSTTLRRRAKHLFLYPAPGEYITLCTDEQPAGGRISSERTLAMIRELTANCSRPVQVFGERKLFRRWRHLAA